MQDQETQTSPLLRALCRLPGFTLFFLMLFVPSAYQPIKAVLLLLVLLTIVLPLLWGRRLALHPKIALITLIMVLTGICFVSYGLISANPGALRVSTVYILWPIFFTLFVAGVARMELITSLLKLLVMAGLAVSLYALSFVLHSRGLLPSYLYIELDQSQRVGFYEGFSKLNLASLATLMFVVPFLLATLIVWPKELNPPISRFWQWVAVSFGLLILLLSGRRAMWIVVASAPVVVMVYRCFLARSFRDASRKTATRALLGLVAILLSTYGYLKIAYDFDISAVYAELEAGFEFTSEANESPFARQQQFYSMLGDWSTRPLVGLGHGAVSRYSIRNEESPWAYELSYLALLFHTGIVGLTIYVSGIIWIYIQGIRMMRSGDKLGLFIFPLLVGNTCFLIANATNPYLETYDHIWVVFFPIALINLWLLQRDYPAEFPPAPIAESIVP